LPSSDPYSGTFNTMELRNSGVQPPGMAGRAGRVGFVVQRRATSCLCQRRIVDGVTSSPKRRCTGSSRVSAAIRARSAQPSLGGRLGVGARQVGGAALGSRSPWLSGLARKHRPAQELEEHQVDQPQRHRRIMPRSHPGRGSRLRGLCAQLRVPTGRGGRGASRRAAGSRDRPDRRPRPVLPCQSGTDPRKARARAVNGMRPLSSRRSRESSTSRSAVRPCSGSDMQ
jgi:hypothetical protein